MYPLTTTAISEAYNRVRQHSETICEPLETEDYVPQPVPFVSPPKWHLAHSTWFFETFILKPFMPGYQVFDTDYNYLFNSYYNNVGERTLRTDRGNVTRPTTRNVYAYRQHVDRHMSELLETLTDPEALALVELGLHHEQQHQELLVTDIKYILGHNPLFPVYKSGHNLVDDTNGEGGFATISEGVYEIGFNSDELVTSSVSTMSSMSWADTKCICTNLKFPKLWLPMQNSSHSWKRAVIRTLTCGWTKAGRG
ncbi:DinB family protein [Dyadobacter chenwenxiniae]|uniref:DinB family protein n=1 Tax=Dyadobacter chenwenxiniae TaxID=2906456 RepID=UPI0035B59C8F